MINKKKLIRLATWLLPLLLIVLALIVFISKCSRHELEMPLSDVMVMDVIQKDVPIYGDWIGTLDGLVNARINAQVSGYLISQNYKEGGLVHKGDLLFKIDSRPFQAALNNAKGQLAQAEARLGKTELDVKRYTPLAKTSAISQEELDDAVQANMAAKAAVDSAQAQVHESELNLGFTRITSPIDGIAGIAEAQVGDLVGPSSPQLTMVSTVDPIKVYFPISEQEFLKAAEKMLAAEKNGITNQPHEKILDLTLVDGTKYPHKGRVIIANRQVNIRTGTILIAGLFDNPRHLLRPGQYAHVRAVVKTCPDAILVPQRAVIETQGTCHVIVVDENNRSSIRSVQMGERHGQFWIVNQGLHPGERVIVEGTQKVREGTIVNPKPYKLDVDSGPTTGTNIPAPGATTHP